MTTEDRIEAPAPVESPAPHPPGHRGRLLFLLALLAILFLLPLSRPLIGQPYNYVLQLMISVLMWIAMTSSWNLIGGYAGYISLGHSVFFGIGGYTSGLIILYFGVSPFLSWPVAGLVAVLFGLLLGLITLRTRGPAFIIATIAMMLMTLLVFDNWDLVGASNGVSLPIPPFPVETVKVPFYYSMLLIACGSVYLGYRVQHSKFGLALRAIAQDETKAEVAGINTRLLKVAAFSLSAFFVGAAGAVWGYLLSYLRPTIFFTISVAASMVLMAIIGGRGTVAGPVIGAVLLVAIDEVSVSQFGSTELNIVITGLILLVFLLFFPEGIVGSLRERGRLPAVLDWD